MPLPFCDELLFAGLGWLEAALEARFEYLELEALLVFGLLGFAAFLVAFEDSVSVAIVIPHIPLVLNLVCCSLLYPFIMERCHQSPLPKCYPGLLLSRLCSYYVT
jgi:hypothetical protein